MKYDYHAIRSPAISVGLVFVSFVRVVDMLQVGEIVFSTGPFKEMLIAMLLKPREHES